MEDTAQTCSLTLGFSQTSVRLARKAFVFFVVHAPREGTEEDSCNEWWKQRGHLPDRFRKVGPIILLGDLNARFGGRMAGRIGSIYLQEW